MTRAGGQPDRGPRSRLSDARSDELVGAAVPGVRQAAGRHAHGTVTPFTDRVSDTDCRDRSDFWKLWNNTTIANGVCFANDGDWGDRIPSVYKVWTGNNGANWVEDLGNRLLFFPGDGNQVCRNTLTFFVNGNNFAYYDIRKESIAGRGYPPCG